LPFLFYGGSHVFEGLLIPFMDSGLSNMGQNPWTLLPSAHFPYGSIMYVILFIPKFVAYLIFGDQALGGTFLSYAAMKLPTLIFDLAMLKVLLKFAPNRERQLVWFYWLNPVLFYINYIYGQFDVVSIYFAILSLALLANDKTRWSAVALAAGILSKFHVFALFPFMMAYIWSTSYVRPGIVKISAYSAILFPLLLLGFLPQIFAGQIGYISMGSPEALTLFGAQIRLDQDRVIFLGFVLSVMVLARLCFSTRITFEGLFFGAGIIFGALILGSAAMPSWYFWFYPFVAVFYATRRIAFLNLYYASCVFYFVHFLGQKAPLLDSWFFKSASFSLLQLSILGLVLLVWHSVIRTEAPLVRRVRPMLWGLAGNSGSGKNYMTDVLCDLLGTSTTVVEGDDYHKWDRGHAKWQDYTHLNPKANLLDQMAQHTRQLVSGKLVYKSHYDHSSGRFTLPRSIEASKNLIIQGLHTFYLKSFRGHFDLKIFLAPDERLRMAWKVLRDVGERGHSLEVVKRSIESRQHDSGVHIDPQAAMADWILEYNLKSDEEPDLETLRTGPEFSVRHILWNDTPLSRLSANLHSHLSEGLRIETTSLGIDKVAVHFEGELAAEQTQRIAEESFDCLRHLTRSYVEPRWRGGQEGITQLIALALIERQVHLVGNT
jgi:uridine kinase